jgi:hypothetical protein
MRFERGETKSKLKNLGNARGSGTHVKFRPDEEVSECVLTYEVRNGARLPNINVDKDMGRWVIVPKEASRIGKHDIEKALDGERARKVEVIQQEVRWGIEDGRRYSANTLSEYLAGKSGLGASRTIRSLISEMMAQGDLFDEPSEDGRKRVVYI